MTKTTALEFPRMGINTQELLDEIERLLERAAQEKDDMGAVNWGDLGVFDIEYRLSMLHPERGPACVVMIEEAEPGGRLAEWLYQQLDSDKFPDTYIECEW